jgi:hypothetical protein
MQSPTRTGSLFLTTLLSAGWLLLGTPAQAAPIFSYTVSVNSTNPLTSGGSTISFTGGSGSNKDAGFGGGTNILLLTTNISSTTQSGSDSFNSSLSFTLTIDDGVGTHQINFTGTVSGGVNSNNSSIVISNFSPSSPLTFDLDGYTYTVSFSVPSLGSVGANTFSVNVSAVADPTPGAVPEPASLALWGLMGLGCAWCARRRMRKPSSAA